MCKKTRNYLVILVRGTAIDIYNQNKKIVPIDEIDDTDTIDLPEMIENRLERERVFEIISTMEEKYSDILMLKLFYDYSNDEIAQFLNINPEHVSIRFFRAKAKLKELIMEEYGANYIDDKLIDNTPHKFSPEFERKMDILMGKSHKKIKVTPKRLLIAVTAALLAVFTLAMSVSAFRTAFINFFMNIFDTHTVVQSVDDEGAPLEFTDKYEITADMSDFELVDFREYISDFEYTYENEHCKIYFTQYIKEYYDIAINTEGYSIEVIYIGGCEGFYVNMYNQNSQIISWDNGDYVLSILVSCDDDYEFSKDELIYMANSVQKVEK
ncbi:MAG: sigma-70 family RNA polymerase sigma factor [Ruminococcus sp.]|nr:sigma-70 family RNA polymerase sigma factor [Ruminococcus sp.]MCM1480111.1 sigma-70 family RNA polymerase sigma factor [Muribaculaceae bacterium]